MTLISIILDLILLAAIVWELSKVLYPQWHLEKVYRKTVEDTGWNKN